MMDCASRFRRWWPAVALCVVALGGLRASREADATVVIYNAAAVGSDRLAKYYAEQRGIPDQNLVGLNTAITPDISRATYETTIAQPLREIFRERGWWTTTSGGRVSQTKIRFVALIRGLPLKIISDGPGVVPRSDQPAAIGTHDEASLDSELACLGFGDFPIPGVIPNPYFRSFAAILAAPVDPGLLLVCRLDGPSNEIVRGMIDAAIKTEKSGLWGWGYVDSRGITSGGYAVGDEWLGNAARRMRAAGIPVLWDKTAETFPDGYPVTDAATYLGWYAGSICGPFAAADFRFRTGAVAVHIHSFSASRLDNPSSGWTAPLVARGAAVSLGNVYEPLLDLTPHLDLFQDRLMEGMTFAESSYASTRGLSWMNISVGDPLYRPYAAWNDLAGSVPSNSPWVRYRDIVRLADGDVLSAASRLARAARETGNSMFLESLAAVQADAKSYSAALKSLDAALAMRNPPMVRFRMILAKIAILRATNQISAARETFLAEEGKVPGPAQAALMARIRAGLFPAPPTPTPTSTP